MGDRPGQATTPPATPIASWTGATIAALERLAISADPTVDFALNIHPESDWDEWLGQAVGAGDRNGYKLGADCDGGLGWGFAEDGTLVVTFDGQVALG